MARQSTITMEGRQFQADGWSSLTGAIAYDTEKQFDGTVCAKFAKGAENRVTKTLAVALGTTAYYRHPFRFSSVAPSANMEFFRVITGSGNIAPTLTTAGKLRLWNSLKAANILTDVFTFEAEKHYLVEVKVLVGAAGNGTVALKIYNGETGATLYESGDKSVEIGNSAITSFSPGHFGSETNCDIYLSHSVHNDSSGEKQNSWAGWAKVVELKPAEDGERSAGWLAPGGGSTNLWKAEDNRPPTGVIDSNLAESAEKQIRDIVSGTTDVYVAKCAAYSTALASGGGGLKEGDTVTLTQAKARGGNSTTTSREIKVRSESNPGPDAAEGSLATGATAAGTEPTGWTTFFGTVNYAPTVTLGTKPGVRVRKATASTNAALVDLMGLIVEYVPGTGELKTLEKSDSITLSESAVKGPALPKGDSLTLSEALARAPSLLKADALAISEQVAKRLGHTAADSISLSESRSVSPTLSKADSVALSEILAKQVGHVAADSITFSDVLSKLAGLSRAETLAVSELIGRGAALARADSLALADAAIRAANKILADSLSLAESSEIVRAGTQLTLSDAITLSDGLQRAAHRVVGDALTLSDTAIMGLVLSGRGLTGQLQGSRAGHVANSSAGDTAEEAPGEPHGATSGAPAGGRSSE
jgi:hypothetical protein